MKQAPFGPFDRDIARARITLSLLAIVSLYVDPSTAGGLFHLTTYACIVLIGHLAYSVLAYFVYRQGNAANLLSPLTVVLDLFFASAITLLTEGQTSPSYIFFVFAIISVGIHSEFRSTLRITLAGVVLYLVVVASSDGFSEIYLMRAVYLAIAGYLVGFFAQQRANYEERLRQFETQAERHTIARSLHDSFVQSLAGINLRLESCQELLRRGRLDDASNELHALQQGVNCEYDRVREFIRSLTERESTSKGHTISANPHVTARLAFSVDSWTAERIFQIAIEAVRNARKHSQASHVDMRAAHDGHNVSITISDNGVGFPSKDTTPWSIASHVAEAGGHLIIAGTGLTRLELSIPA